MLRLPQMRSCSFAAPVLCMPPPAELLHKDAAFRFVDRKLMLAATLGSDREASAAVEFARQQGGGLLATLCSSYKQKRLHVHRAHLSNAACGLHASYCPFPADTPLALGRLKCVLRAQNSFARVSSGADDVAGGGLTSGGEPLPAWHEHDASGIDGEGTVALEFEDESAGASVALTLEGDIVAAKLRATALLRAKGVLGGTASLGVELVSGELRPRDAELVNVAVGFTGELPSVNVLLPFFAPPGPADAAAAVAPAPGMGGGDFHLGALSGARSTTPPSLAATGLAPSSGTSSSRDGGGAGGGGGGASGTPGQGQAAQFSAILRTDNSEEFRGWRAACVQRHCARHALALGVDLRQRARRAEEEVGSSSISLLTTDDNASAFLLTVGCSYVLDPEINKSVSAKADSSGVVGIAVKQRLSLLSGTALLSMELCPSFSFDELADSTKLGFSFTADGVL